MGTAAGFLIIIICIGLYILPTIIAWQREHANKASILALNLLLGWTFLGWVVALVWSFTAKAQTVSIAPATPQPKWMTDERDCPHCAERIKRQASVCKHCQREVVPLG